jgi:glutathione peroxidase
MVVALRIFLANFLFRFRQSLRSKPSLRSGSVHDFKMVLLSGEKVPLSTFKGSKLLIVNTASRCAYTPQLADLEKLHRLFYPKLIVLGFPSNDFFWQEPGSNDEIADFCMKNYGVSFPMFQKISVTGKNIHPLYRFLKEQSGNSPIWNFCKYLINEEGKVMHYFHTKVKPMDSRITQKI